MSWSGKPQRYLGVALVLAYGLTLCLPFIEMRFFDKQSSLLGWQVWVGSFFVLSDGQMWARLLLLPLLSAASVISLIISVGLAAFDWRWIFRPVWRGFAVLMCLAYVAAPWVLVDPARYLIGYFVGLIFHGVLVWALFKLKSNSA